VNPAKLRAILADLTAEAGFRLREGGFTARRIILKLRYHDFETHTHQRVVPAVFADEDIYRVGCELLEETFTRRVGVRLIGIRLAMLVRDLHQLPLFEWERRIRQQNLYGAVDRIRGLYGHGALMTATASTARDPQEDLRHSESGEGAA